MEREKWGVHVHHCCGIHGCKYGKKDCPVKNKEVQQQYLCETCTEDGLQTIEDLIEYQNVQVHLKEAKMSGQKTMTVPVTFLDRILHPTRDSF